MTLTPFIKIRIRACQSLDIGHLAVQTDIELNLDHAADTHCAPLRDIPVILSTQSRKSPDASPMNLAGVSTHSTGKAKRFIIL